MRLRTCALLLGASVPAMTLADTQTSSVSDLEEVTVYASREQGAAAQEPGLGAEVVTQEQMRLLNRDTLDRAVLLASGTAVSMVGARNETDVWIRGFDRWRVPLYQDGIPVYLPVDNRIDFGRFSTVDVAEIQLAKGFASVIDGPGALGGSINLVSRVVAQPFEAEGRFQSVLDSDGGYNRSVADAFLGTRRDNWFVQVAGSFDRQSHFRLSDDFQPGTFQGAGDRFGSYHQDYKVNVKAGYEPSADAQYALNYIEQVGKKDNPPPDTDIPPALLKTVRFWNWPAWNKRSLYWLSKNVLDAEGSFVKVRLYYDRFFNQLDAFDTIAYDTQNLPKSFDSTYKDYAAGGGVEADKVLAGGLDTVRVSGHFRWDQHNETEGTRNTPFGTWYQQPWETAEEDTWSVAAENIFRPSKAWQFVVGTSYDARHLIGDSQWVVPSGPAASKPPYGASFAYPVSDKHAINGEAAATYFYSGDGALHLSYADRARFPTLFEMYSTRFGTFQNNPDLQPERSHYVQAGITDQLAGTHVVANVFYAVIADAITSVPLSPTKSENQNTGQERQIGYEVELSRALLPSLQGRIDYSYLSRVEVSGGAVPTDTPSAHLLAYLDWRPWARLSVVPNLDLIGRRWLQNAVNQTVYYHAGSFALLGLKGAYRPLESVVFEIGATNVADRNYVIEDGYNGPGRQYFANVRVSF
jgi:iron complex outermembrane receptor protein